MQATEARSGKIRRALKKVGMDGELSALLAGEDLASTAPTKELMTISAKIRRDIELTDWLLRQSSDSDILSAIRLRKPEIATAIESYIDRYGDRVVAVR